MDNTTPLRQGLSQAAHPELRKLPLAARAIYATLCGLLNIGEPQAISQEEIAEATGVSEATVSKHMSVLAEHGLIDRSWSEDGYILELLPLPAAPAPEERLAQIRDQLAERRRLGSPADPTDGRRAPQRAAEAEDGATTPEIDDEEPMGSAADPTACMDDYESHDYIQQQHGARDKISGKLPVVSEAAWERMLAGTPGYDTARFEADYRILIARGKEAVQAIGLIVWARSRGQVIWAADQLDQRARSYHQRVCPGAQRADVTLSPTKPRRQQQPETGRNTPLDLTKVEERRQLAEQLLPPGADLDLRLCFFAALDDGLDGPAALAAALEECEGASYV